MTANLSLCHYCLSFRLNYRAGRSEYRIALIRSAPPNRRAPLYYILQITSYYLEIATLLACRRGLPGCINMMSPTSACSLAFHTYTYVEGRISHGIFVYSTAGGVQHTKMTWKIPSPTYCLLINCCLRAVCV